MLRPETPRHAATGAPSSTGPPSQEKPGTPVPEVVARVLYQAWESIAYVAIAYTHERPHFALCVFELVKKSRDRQDNDQCRLSIVEALLREREHEERSLERIHAPRFGLGEAVPHPWDACPPAAA